jgi:dihydrofolate reductase
MGRKTYESIPLRFRPLSGRHNIIVTRNPNYQTAGATVVHSPDEALAAAGAVAEIIIGGGAELFAAFLPVAGRIYLTTVEGTFVGDTFFPPFDIQQWRETYSQRHDPDERHPYPFRWSIVERDRMPSTF